MSAIPITHMEAGASRPVSTHKTRVSLSSGDEFYVDVDPRRVEAKFAGSDVHVFPSGRCVYMAHIAQLVPVREVPSSLGVIPERLEDC